MKPPFTINLSIHKLSFNPSLSPQDELLKSITQLLSSISSLSICSILTPQVPSASESGFSPPQASPSRAPCPPSLRPETHRISHLAPSSPLTTPAAPVLAPRPAPFSEATLDGPPPNPRQHLACASSRLWSVMAMICCRTSPVLEPGGSPGGERRGAGGGGAGRGGRCGASMSCGCSTRSWRAWRARADVVANCCSPCAPCAHPGAPALAAAYGQPPPAGGGAPPRDTPYYRRQPTTAAQASPHRLETRPHQPLSTA